MQSQITFEPDQLAEYEAKSWEAYYRRDWLKFLWLITKLGQKQFKFPLGRAIQAAYYIVRASAEWAKPVNNQVKVQKYLKLYYRLARRYSDMVFDPDKVAGLELAYWEVHRRLVDQADKTEYVEVMTQLHSAIFGLTPEQARPSAEARVLASNTVDAIVKRTSTDLNADWARLRENLKKCYNSVKEEAAQSGETSNTAGLTRWPDGWHTRSRYAIRDYIKTLNPRTDYAEIAFLTASYEFPYDTTRSLEFAMMKTFCAPRMSALLCQTGEFLRDAQKRYDDTVLILSEILEWGMDSERGKAATRLMNRMHNHYPIYNEDFVYVLSTFVLEPIRWMEKFGWRCMTREEQLANYYYWQEMARRMNIKDLPPTLEELDSFNRVYERKNFRYSETNRQVGVATRDLYLGWYPGFMRPLVEKGIYAMLDNRSLEAFGFPKPAPATRLIVGGLVKLRGALIKLSGPRRFPRLLTQTKARSYTEGYRIEQLGSAAVHTNSRKRGATYQGRIEVKQ